MNRSWPLLSLVVLIFGAFALHGESSSTLVIQPSEMKDGEQKSITDDGRTITVRRNGNTTHVTIEGADKTEKLTITREGNRLRIGRVDADGTRSFVFGPDRKQIVIDGIPLGNFEGVPHIKPLRPNAMQSFFVCPKDKTTLRVPEGKDDATYKCPVDGTVMEKKRGRGFTFFFDDSSIETHEM